MSHLDKDARIRQLEEELRLSNEKWRAYEREYILPSFHYAKSIGFDLEAAVHEKAGKNCVQVLTEHLIESLVAAGLRLTNFEARLDANESRQAEVEAKMKKLMRVISALQHAQNEGPGQ